MSEDDRTVTSMADLFGLPPGTILRCTGRDGWLQALVVTNDTWVGGIRMVVVSGDERPLGADDDVFLPAVIVYQP